MSVSRIIALAAILSTPQFAAASPVVDPGCQLRPGEPDNCVPVVGCIGDEGRYFVGEAVGWDAGTLAAETDDGLICSGRWQARTAIGAGQANFQCGDQLNGLVLFTYQDHVTGTTTGRGATNEGQGLRVWSGHNIRQYVEQQSGSVDAQLMCGSSLIPLG